MSHAVRLPLNVILNFNEILQDSLNDEQKIELQEITESSYTARKRIPHTINSILDILLLETWNYKYKLKMIDINSDVLRKKYNQYNASEKYETSLMWRDGIACSRLHSAR